MPLLDPFEQKLAIAWSPTDWQDLGVLAAVSGGADSVALVSAMAALKREGAGRLTVAHFNHHWRGAASDADEAFVVELARQLSLECVVGSADPLDSARNDDGAEAAARAARYDFLRTAAETRGARYVVAAHTADDQAETVLHHLLRGTGLAGLSGMSRTRRLGPAVTLIRPMLHAKRHEVVAYLTSLGQGHCEDATNQNPQFMRNRIRHELLPRLERDYSPGVVESLLRLSTIAAESQRVIDAAAEPLRQRAIVETRPNRVALDCRALVEADRHLVREVFAAIWRQQGWPLQAMGFAEWNALAEMVIGPAGDHPGYSGRAPGPRQNASATRVFPGAITAQKKGERLTLVAPPEPSE